MKTPVTEIYDSIERNFCKHLARRIYKSCKGNVIIRLHRVEDTIEIQLHNPKHNLHYTYTIKYILYNAVKNELSVSKEYNLFMTGYKNYLRKVLYFTCNNITLMI